MVHKTPLSLVILFLSLFLYNLLILSRWEFLRGIIWTYPFVFEPFQISPSIIRVLLVSILLVATIIKCLPNPQHLILISTFRGYQAFLLRHQLSEVTQQTINLSRRINAHFQPSKKKILTFFLCKLFILPLILRTIPKTGSSPYWIVLVARSLYLCSILIFSTLYDLLSSNQNAEL